MKPRDEQEDVRTVGYPGGWRARLLRWRVRLARFILLPELSSQEAYELRHKVIEQSAANQGYVLMCALSAGIATLGLLQGSAAVVIGAMLISPLMAPIAALGFGFASIDGHRIRDAARVVLIGAVIGILVGILLTWISPIRNATPEIIARTEPTLLDLAVALLSGIAGGYATVIGKGETTIGVAIATALMPPLATVGYGIGVMQPMFALGALLLFLTNLSAIAFAFALIARLSGAARPIRNVEWTPRYVAAGITAFLVLATPLALTLLQVTREARLRSAARTVIADVTHANGLGVAQLDANWSMFGQPQVSAVVVAPAYSNNADAEVARRLAKITGGKPFVNLQQVLAADAPSQTRALVDAAMERTVAGIAADVPPIARLRSNIGLPTRGVWLNRAERSVTIEPVAAPGWTLAHYRAAESSASAGADGWNVRLFPPVQGELLVGGEPANSDAVAPDLAVWALQRWGMAKITLVPGPEGVPPELTDALKAARIDFDQGPVDPTLGKLCRIVVLAPPPQLGGQTPSQ